MKNKILFVVMLITLSISAQHKGEIYKDMNAPRHERILDLLARMTVEEKISLLRATSPCIPRLGIDKYYHGNEALHGVVRPGKFTVFPQAIGLSSMWNPDLLFQVSSVISDEARARWNELGRGTYQQSQFSDLLTFWSPTVNMARDPRWGRTPETYGEDPFLSGILGVSFVKGLQGNNPKYLKVVATPKHFAANNEEHNRSSCNARISERDLREFYLPAFERCIIDGKAQSIMTSYTAINGVPSTVNSYLIQKVLRQDWGFKGYVVSDCGALDWLITDHKYVKTTEVPATLAIKAGLDMECGDHIFIEPLLSAYKQFMVNDAEIDSAAYHILRGRMLLGLFDDPTQNPYNSIDPSVIGCKQHQDLALEAARQSLVLLKNENHMLPINPKKIKSVAVVGINAGNSEFGDYSGTPLNGPVTILEGIKKRLGDGVKVVYAPWVSSVSGYELIPKSFFPNGLKAEYYSNKDLSGTPKIRIDANINYDPVNNAPDPFILKAPTSIRWTGDLCPTVSGQYTLNLETDDGCRLFLDDTNLIDSWNDRSAQSDKVNVTLEGGKKYKLRIEYYDGGGSSISKLYWKSPDIDKRARLDLFGEAGEAARKCDMTIAVLGINNSLEREGQDRLTLELPIDQQEFIREMYKVNPNTVVVLEAGSSLAINWIDEHIPAILDAWYPGEQGGTAVAEALFGDYNPGGRLPLTFYNSLEELPPFDDYEINKGRTYQYFKGNPLYEFGYGLSYTSFKYKNMHVSKGTDTIQVEFSLSNIGKYDGDEVAQLYVEYPETGTYMPIKQLRGFKRVHIQKGKTEKVNISVLKKDLRYWDEKVKYFVTPEGSFVFQLGSSSKKIQLKQIMKL